MPTYNRKKFFEGFRQEFGALKQDQVDALEFLLDAFEADTEWRDVRHVSYALATIKHETAHTFEPITEYGNRAYFSKYNGRADLGNTKPDDGYRFRGRGYVQITGRKNYARFGLEDKPTDALEPQVAFNILTVGMHRGSFTGKKLSDYINDNKVDYRNARRIINALDKADRIAEYAKDFEKILKASQNKSQFAKLKDDEIILDLPNQIEDINSAAVPAEIPTVSTSEQANETLTPATTQPPIQVADAIVNTADTSNQQDVNVPAAVTAPEPYNGVGFISTLKKDIAALGVGNFTFQGLSEYAQHAAGMPEWLIDLTKIAGFLVLGFTVCWFVFRLIHYLVDTAKKNAKTKLEADAATSTVRKDIEWRQL